MTLDRRSTGEKSGLLRPNIFLGELTEIYDDSKRFAARELLGEVEIDPYNHGQSFQ